MAIAAKFLYSIKLPACCHGFYKHSNKRQSVKHVVALHSALKPNSFTFAFACKIRIFFVLIFAFCNILSITFPGPAWAKGPLYRNHLAGVGAHDPRKRVDPTYMPWAAIGRVQTELGTRCTGFLLSPILVETAAHCLWQATTKQFVQAHSVHFLLAYQAGHYSAHGRVQRFIIPPGYKAGSANTAGLDRATLVLENPIAPPETTLRAPTIAMAVHAGSPVMLGGYEQNQPDTLTADQHCTLTGMQQDQAGHFLLAHTCAGTHGSSGAPLLYATPQGWQAIGIQTLAARNGAGGLATLLNTSTVFSK